MNVKEIRVKCGSCGGSGVKHHYDNDWGEWSCGCETCGGSGGRIGEHKTKPGSGYEYIKFQVLDTNCNFCGGSKVATRTWTETGDGLFGYYRKEKSETIKCPECLGVGKQLKQIWRGKCESCSGKGKVSYWVKGFFGTEYLREKTCSNCRGSGKVDEPSTVVFNGGRSL